MEEGTSEFGQWGHLQIGIVAVVVSLLVVLLSWVSRLPVVQSGRGYHLPPGPIGWPLIGAIPYLGKLPHWSFFELSKRYGPVMFMHLGSVPVLVISNREMAKSVFQTNDQNFASRPGLLVARCLTYNFQDMIWSPYGSHWKQGAMEQEILHTIHFVLEQSQFGGKDDGNVNMSTTFGGMAMNMITHLLWRKRHRNIKGSASQQDKDLHQLVRDLMAIGGANNIADLLSLDILKSIAMKVSGLERKAKKLHKGFDILFESIICEKEKALLQKAKDTADEDDFATVMLKLMNQDENPLGLSRDKVKAILADMLVAGTDTSAVTIEWTLAYLMRYPHVMKKVQDELTEAVGEDRLVRESDVPNLKYLNALVKETLRTHSPAAAGVPHLSQAACKVGGHDVPANTMVFFNLTAIHHDSSVWENPFEFNPDRFLGSALDYRGHDYEFLPFGAGRRMCPGYNLASKFLHLALAQLLHTVQWSLPADLKPESMDMSEAAGAVASRATPLFLVAKPRLANQVIYSTST